MAIDGPRGSRPRVWRWIRVRRRRCWQSVWEDVRAAERAVLDHTTIAQLAEQCSAHEWMI